jgi:CheY-like chemotaxis protein
LSTVYGIVQQSGGTIEVETAPGRGTTFRVLLPRCAEPAPASLATPAWREVPRGTETILLAEDDEGVRGLAAVSLRAQGYTVLEARDGQEALDVWQRQGARIDLLITNVIMPRLGGRRLAEVLSAARPGLRVLYLSGYTDDEVMRQGVLTTEAVFLEKPFTATALVRKVREVLDQRGAPEGT